MPFRSLTRSSFIIIPAFIQRIVLIKPVRVIKALVVIIPSHVHVGPVRLLESIVVKVWLIRGAHRLIIAERAAHSGLLFAHLLHLVLIHWWCWRHGHIALHCVAEIGAVVVIEHVGLSSVRWHIIVDGITRFTQILAWVFIRVEVWIVHFFCFGFGEKTNRCLRE